MLTGADRADLARQFGRGVVAGVRSGPRDNEAVFAEAGTALPR